MRLKLVGAYLDLIEEGLQVICAFQQQSDIELILLNLSCLLATQFQDAFTVSPDAELGLFHHC